jgi:hypothetical protein
MQVDYLPHESQKVNKEDDQQVSTQFAHDANSNSREFVC